MNLNVQECWSTGVAYSAEVASATKAGLEYWEKMLKQNPSNSVHHSNTPLLHHSGDFNEKCSTYGGDEYAIQAS
jgi:hypothetical protein